MNLTAAITRFDLENTVRAGLTRLTNAARADEIWTELGKEWRFVVNNKATGRGGMCSPPSPFRGRTHGAVEVHGLYFKDKNLHLRNDTVLHEVAHAVQWILNDRTFRGIKPHGREWKNIMLAFGADPRRTVTEDFSAELRDLKAQKAKLIYACKACGHEFPAMRPWKNIHRRYHRGCGPSKGGGIYLKADLRTGQTFTPTTAPKPPVPTYEETLRALWPQPKRRVRRRQTQSSTYSPNAIIRMLVSSFPHRAGSQAELKSSFFEDGMTVAEYEAAGNRSSAGLKRGWHISHIRYCIQYGFIKVED